MNTLGREATDREEEEGERSREEDENLENAEEEGAGVIPPVLAPPRANRSKRGGRRLPVALQTLDSHATALTTPTAAENPDRRPPVATCAELPADVWAHIAHIVADEAPSDEIPASTQPDEECICSWPLVPAAIALPCIRRALTEVSELEFDDRCPCRIRGFSSAVPLSQRIRSFAWLRSQFPDPPHLILNVFVSPPPIVCSLMNSVLFPSLSSLTSTDLYFSQSLPSPPRLLFSLSQAPCLESLCLVYEVPKTSAHEVGMPGMQRCVGNDPVFVADMWELVNTMEGTEQREKERGKKEQKDKERGKKEQKDKERGKKEQKDNEQGDEEQEKEQVGRSNTVTYFPALRTLKLELPACSPLVLRLISRLAPQLHSINLSSSSEHFALHEGDEEIEGSAAVGAEGGRAGPEGGVNSTQRTFTLHFPLVTTVILTAIDCAISLSAPLLSSLFFVWRTPCARLTLLPSCPTHLPFLFLIGSVPWAFHAPHLTALDYFHTNMLPSQVAQLPPSMVTSVRSLDWQTDLCWNLDLSAWSSLCCFRVRCRGPVLLPVLRSVVWPRGVEQLFLDIIEEDIAEVLKGDKEVDGSGNIWKRGGSMGMEGVGAMVSQESRPVGLIEESEMTR